MFPYLVLYVLSISSDELISDEQDVENTKKKIIVPCAIDGLLCYKKSNFSNL